MVVRRAAQDGEGDLTWVVGMPTPFGAAVAVSDVRVCWSDGSNEDCLRKVYPVHQNMACGFAGSVELGFAMVADLTKCLRAIPRDNVPFPAIVTWRWWRRARRIFGHAPQELRRLGCSLVILGVTPLAKPGIPWNRSYVATLQAPDFRPQFVVGLARCASIGSGRGVKEYRRAIEGENLVLLQGAIGHDRPGIGVAQFLSSRLWFTVKERRASGVSEHLQVTGVDLRGIWAQEVRIGEFSEEGEPIYSEVPKIATSYEEFLEIQKSKRSKAIVAQG